MIYKKIQRNQKRVEKISAKSSTSLQQFTWLFRDVLTSRSFEILEKIEKSKKFGVIWKKCQQITCFDKKNNVCTVPSLAIFAVYKKTGTSL